MLDALEQFRENVVRVRSLGGLTLALNSMTTPIVDTSDILRAQHVLAVSALDHYIHEIARKGMLETFDGARSPSAAYLRFRISLDCLTSPNASIPRSAVESEIRVQHSFLAFQQPDKIADAVRLVSDVKLWEAVAKRLTGAAQNAKDVKDRLRLIVDRRNKIAHEADLDPTYPKVRWPITSSDVNDVVDFIVSLVEAIHAEVA